MAVSPPVPATSRRVRLLSEHHAALVAVFLFTLLIYLATLTQVHTFDALSYVTSVEHKPWTEIFHPHHLAYGPLGALALHVGQLLGYQGGAALPMQIVNACAGALGVAWFYVLVRRLAGRTDLALCAALLLGGAYAYWYYAVEIEVYTVATLFLIICLDFLTRRSLWHSRRQLLALGLAQGGAILFHQTNVLLCVPIGVALLGQALGQRRTSTLLEKPGVSAIARLVAGRWWMYALTLALTVGVPYFVVGVVISGFRSWAAFDSWLTDYARTGWWGGPITAQKWAGLATGLADTLAQPGGALLGLMLIGLLVLYMRQLRAIPRPFLAALLAWLLVYGAFFLWWEPDNIEFWIASLPPAVMLLVLALRADRQWGPAVWLALAIGATSIGLNYDAITRRGDAATDLQRVVAREIAARSQPADLLLVPDGLVELYLPYYEQHDNFQSLNQAMFDHSDDWAQACAAVRARVDTTLHAGAQVLIADEVLRPPALLLERHHISAAQVQDCFAPYGEALQFVPMLAQVPAYWRLDMGQARAVGAGWRFDRFAQGWQAANVSQELFAQGWHFVPDSDPSLTSPLLKIDTSQFSAIEIRLANGTAAHDAQLFFAGPDGSIAEERAMRWSLQPTSQAVTYRIELAGQRGWQGTITRLRLDPVGVGDGGQMRLEWIRLVPSG